jgi:arylamine N-acetyltransferase
MESQPTYTEAQLEAYLKRIAYNPRTQDASLVQDVRQRIQTDALATLSELQRRHLTAVPWGNSGLHYSQHHTISLNPSSLYEKMVDRRLDGYCMENSGLFLIVLRSLGFFVYATGGRVSQAAATGIDNGLYLSLYALPYLTGRELFTNLPKVDI